MVEDKINYFSNMKFFPEEKDQHTRIESQFECTFKNCLKSYSNTFRLQVHMRTHTGYKPFACIFCQKDFNEKGNLKTHLRVHTGEKPYACDSANCESTFKTQGQLKEHSVIHFKNKEKFRCEFCKSSYSRDRALTHHLKKHINKNLIEKIVSNKKNVKDEKVKLDAEKNQENFVNNFNPEYMKFWLLKLHEITDQLESLQRSDCYAKFLELNVLLINELSEILPDLQMSSQNDGSFYQNFLNGNKKLVEDFNMCSLIKSHYEDALNCNIDKVTEFLFHMAKNFNF